MGVFNIDRNTILRLLDERLYDSAEYWSALLLSEKNLESTENVARITLYADCLFQNEKYKQAAYYYQLSLSLLSCVNNMKEREEKEDKLHFQLYECEYKSACDKEDRMMIRNCILFLEAIPSSRRSSSIWMRLSTLYWCCNDYENAATSANCVLKEEPYAIEAIQILARIADFKEMKTTTEFTLPVLDSPENTIEVAELNLLSDPHNSESLFRQVSDSLQPSVLLYRQLALSNLFSFRFERFVKWVEMLQMIDSAHFFDDIARLSSSLSRTFHYQTQTNPSTVSTVSTVSTDDSQVSSTPFFLIRMIEDCTSDSPRESASLEQRHWDLVNYFPSYFSYSLLLRFYQTRNQPMRAAALAQQLYQHNQTSFHANLLYAKVLMDVPSEKHKAETILLHCHAAKPKHIETAHLLGLLYYRQRRYEEAIQVIGEIIDSEVPIEIKQLLCECYLKNGDSIPYLRLQYMIK